MNKQHFEEKNEKIRNKFLELKSKHPDRFQKKLLFSWSNWVFGTEDLEDSIRRLKKFGVNFIELHGNRYGKDLGYEAKTVKKILNDNGMTISGIDGMFSRESELASTNPLVRQTVIDYIRRNLELGFDLKATYFIIAPGAVGRSEKYDEMEFYRSAEALRKVADDFVKTDIRGVIEPIQLAEVSLCHTFEDAKAYIKAVNHPGVKHINGDVYHMMVGESHIGESIINAGDMLVNLHLADSNRDALGEGSIDLDIIIMALYCIGYNTRNNCYVTAEPLPRGKNVSKTFYGITKPKILDELVKTTIHYFQEREEAVLSL